MLLIKKKKLSSRSMFLDELLGIISLNNCLINERIRSFLISDVLIILSCLKFFLQSMSLHARATI